MECIVLYVFIACIFFVMLDKAVELNLQEETDQEIIQIFESKSVKFTALVISSIFWLPVCIAIIYNNFRQKG